MILEGRITRQKIKDKIKKMGWVMINRETGEIDLNKIYEKQSDAIKMILEKKKENSVYVLKIYLNQTININTKVTRMSGASIVYRPVTW